MLDKVYNKIPQNEKENIDIKIGNWKNSIDLIIKRNSKIYLDNVFLIFKIYLNDTTLGLNKVLIITEEGEAYNKKTIIFKKINTNKLKRMSLDDFEEWFDESYIEIWKYVKKINSFGFRFCFNSGLKNFEELEIYPKYPWPENITKIIKKHILWEEEINQLKKKIKELEEELKKKTPAQ